MDFFVNDEAHQLEVIKTIRAHQPKIVLCNAIDDRHIDHAKVEPLWFIRLAMLCRNFFYPAVQLAFFLNKIVTKDNEGNTSSNLYCPDSSNHFRTISCFCSGLIYFRLSLHPVERDHTRFRNVGDLGNSIFNQIDLNR